MMRTRITAIAAVAAALMLPGPPGPSRADEGGPFKISTLSVADRVLYLVDEDLDHDGLHDIMIIHRKGLHPDETRWISIFWQREDGGFSSAADQSWEIAREAVAIDIGDVTGDGLKEVCLLTPTGVLYHRIADGAYDLAALPLFETDGLLGRFASERAIPRIDFVRDWSGDGRDDVAVFKFDGLSIFRRDDADSFTVENALAMEPRTGVSRNRSMGEAEQTPGLSVSYTFPALKLIDYDADGRDDLFAVHDDRLRVYRRQADGSFEREPAVDRRFDVLTQREKIEGIANVETIVHDINNDGYADAIVTKQTSKGLSSFRGVINIFHGSPHGFAEQPQQVIISEGTASSQALIRDVNGDGRLDLILPSVNISISAIIRFLVTRSVPINFNIFLLQEDNRFSERPDFTKEVKFKIDFSGDTDTQAMDLDGDYNGDRRKDFAFGTGEQELSIFLGVSGRKGELFSRKPVAVVKVDAFGEMRSPDLNNDGYSDMIIHYPQSREKRGMVQVLMNRGRL